MAKASAEPKPKQSYQEAWRLICQAQDRAGAATTADRASRSVAVAEWITEHVINKQARYWWIGFGKVKDDRRRAFLAEAKRAGQPVCPLAELLFPQAAVEPAKAP